MRPLKTPLIAFLCVLMGMALLPLASAQAQNQPPVLPLDDSVEPIAGVVDPDPNALSRWLAEDAAVWDIEVIGDTVYVGGTFQTVAEKYDERRHSHSYLAAFNGTTGDWIDWWLPQLDGAVYSLDTSSTGALLVGGEFTTVNGDTNHAGLVALDPVSFEIDTSFRSNVERRWTTEKMVVRDLLTVDNRLYVTGNFNHINNTRLYKVARMDRTTGAVDQTFKPRLTGRTAYAVSESADGTRVHLGGQFDAVNGEPGTAILATVYASNGELVPGWDWNFSTFCCKDPKILAMAVYGDNLFVAGSNDFWAMISSSTGETRRLVPQSETHDPQVIEVFGDRVYIGCHCSRRGDWVRAVDASTGQDLESFSADWTGNDGGWALGMAPDGCLWSGGGYDSGLRADGVRVFAGNLLRTCPVGGPVPHNETVISQPAAFTCAVTVAGNGTTTVSWTDIGASGYDLSHDGGDARWVTATSAVDATPGVNYSITAWGNGVSGKNTTCVNPNPGGGTQFTCSVTVAANGTTTISWTDLGASGYDVSDDGGSPRWVTATSAVDATPGVNYSITAWGNGVSGETTTCVNPNPGAGVQFTCTVSRNNGAATITWTDLGANGYDVSADGAPARWVTGTTTADNNAGQSYSITAWGNGLGGETTTCQ